MRVFMVSYADGPRVHRLNQRALARSALGRGVDIVRSCGKNDLQPEFRARYAHILDQPRGAGYWLWKPYLVQACLAGADDGDIVVYADAGLVLRRPLDPLIEAARQHGLVLFQKRFLNAHYVKRDCFVVMQVDHPACHHATQMDASLFLVRNTEANRRFVGTWLDHCLDERVLTDRANECGLPNLPGFVAHRHDQSALSLIYWKEAATLAHQLYSDHVRHSYVYHHRRRVPWVPIAVWHWFKPLGRRLHELKARGPANAC
jgi:hypothetical protein